MNTPNQSEIKFDLPKISFKKKSYSIGFKQLNKIRKNLNLDFKSYDLNQNKFNQDQIYPIRYKSVKSAKIFPELNLICPGTPKKKIDVPNGNFPKEKLDKIKKNLFFADDNYQTPTKKNNIEIPKVPRKKSKNEQDMRLDNFDEYICRDDDHTINLIFDHDENVKRQLVF
jgi:hypothetical protein